MKVKTRRSVSPAGGRWNRGERGTLRRQVRTGPAGRKLVVPGRVSSSSQTTPRSEVSAPVAGQRRMRACPPVPRAPRALPCPSTLSLPIQRRGERKRSRQPRHERADESSRRARARLGSGKSGSPGLSRTPAEGAGRVEAKRGERAEKGKEQRARTPLQYCLVLQCDYIRSCIHFVMRLPNSRQMTSPASFPTFSSSPPSTLAHAQSLLPKMRFTTTLAALVAAAASALAQSSASSRSLVPLAPRAPQSPLSPPSRSLHTSRGRATWLTLAMGLWLILSRSSEGRRGAASSVRVAQHGREVFGVPGRIARFATRPSASLSRMWTSRDLSASDRDPTHTV